MFVFAKPVTKNHFKIRLLSDFADKVQAFTTLLLLLNLFSERPFRLLLLTLTIE